MRGVLKNHRLILLSAMALFVLCLATPSFARADDFYVITGTFKTQSEAQQVAATKGGWVLNTNFYNQLTPGVFAVVRGPYRSKGEADTQLSELERFAIFAGSYVRNAGNINIEIKIGNKELSPQMLAALLGELRIDVSENAGGNGPCEPQEPYKAISLSYVTVERASDMKNGKVTDRPKDVKLDIGGLWQLKRSGAVDRMRICTE